jgi:hypothetical protein
MTSPTEQESAGDIVKRLRACAGPWSDRDLTGDAIEEIETLRLQKTGLEALLCDGQAEIVALKHDIARHVEICSQQAEEIERLRARVAALEQSS